jgi:hypothetical protein
MAGPVRRDVEQRPLTVYSRTHSRRILRKEQIQGAYLSAASRLGCLVFHLADDSSSLTRWCLAILVLVGWLGSHSGADSSTLRDFPLLIAGSLHQITSG